ncbi:MAG: CPBP family intramembrane metalloprotease [Rhabdochlamydiaceae bacterium]|nr:CPBP family intramembrane metalloprotease [Candidatus Amphrikana amoebophyrae]
MTKQTTLAALLFVIITTAVFGDEEKITPSFSESIELKQNQILKTETNPYERPTFEKKKKNVFITMGLTALIPGLGHAYLDEFKKAGALAGSYGLGMGLHQAQYQTNEYMYADIITQNTRFYSMYAAYRDLREYNGELNYRFKMPQESITDLTLAPFQWSVIKKPEVWGGILGAFTIGAAISHLAHFDNGGAHIGCSVANSMYPLSAFPVGIGEEAFFRGYCQPAISEISNQTTGLIGSSLIFGAAHWFNASNYSERNKRKYHSYIIPFITSFGAYFGWLAQKNNSLKESVAVHAWYDFAIFLTSAIASGSIKESEPRFQMTFAF